MFDKQKTCFHVYEQKNSLIGKNWFVKYNNILSNSKKSYNKLNF